MELVMIRMKIRTIIRVLMKLQSLAAEGEEIMYDLRVIVAVVALHQFDIRTCTAQIVHKLYCNISMML